MNTATAVVGIDPPRVGVAPNRQYRVLCVLFFFSGFPALIYQLVWQRALFRILGVNIESVTIVVTAFMLGLGLGSLAGGWLSRRPGFPLLLLLATIEALTGAFGLVSLSIFESVGGFVLGSPLPVTALVTLALVVVPTLLMGATLPLLVGHLVRRSGNVGKAVGQLYYVNTLGAGVACLACAAALFPLLGMQGSVLVAVALNAAVALGAVAAHVRDRHPMQSYEARVDLPRPAVSMQTTLPFGAVLAMACVGGLVSLSYEIFFFRTMSYATGSSPFAFATTLGAFLIGLASGARLAAEACAESSSEALLRQMFRYVLAASVVGGAFLPLLGHLAVLPGAIFGVGLLMVYVLALEWGFVLPCLAHLGVSAGAQAGMRTGQLYLANIVGAVAGSVLTGFVLMDHLTLIEIGQSLVVAGVACTLLLNFTTGVPRAIALLRAGAIVGGGVTGALLLPFASGHLLESLQWKGNPESRVPFARVVENRSGIVTVDRTGTVFGNGAYDGHFNVDLTNDVNGIVRPYALSLFHAAPRDVLMVGLASGSWAQVLANNPQVASLTIVEINPGYAKLIAGNAAVASVLKHPKVRFITDDGRRWLRLNAGRRFDAIVTNTTFHYRANSTNLLSSDYLTILKAHLNPGGIVFYNTTHSSRVQRTGCSVFAHGARFTNHVVLSQTPIDWNFARWRNTLEAYQIDGRPMFNPAIPEHVAGMSGLMALSSQTEPGAPPDPARSIEPCDQVLTRTAGQSLITDDNMGTEWRPWENP